jgi:hypothetical protein
MRLTGYSLSLVTLIATTVLVGFHQLTFAQRAAHVPPPSSVTQIAPSAQPRARAGAVVKRPSVGNVMVNVNPATLLLPQTEPSIASNPDDFRQLVTGFADQANGDFAPGVSLSRDGASSWVLAPGGAILPDPPGFSWGLRTVATNLAGGDAAVAWGLHNTVFFNTLGFHDNSNPPNNDCSAGGLYVYRSDDGGMNWTLPAAGPAIANEQLVFRDKSYIAADVSISSPHRGNLYVVWDDDHYSGCPQVFSNNFVQRDISFSVSADQGATWSTPVALASGCLVAPVPAVAPNGNLFVVWYDCNFGNSAIRQMVRKSTDGGISFQLAVAAASGLVAPPNPLIGSRFRVNAAFPSIATDPTNGDNIYVVWSSDNGPSQTDVFFARSLDGGATWSERLRVNDDPIGNPHDQFFPWIAVGARGTIRVMWGDDRLDTVNPGGKLYDIFMAQSKDHGASFSPNVRVTNTSSDPDFDGFNGTFIGDYFGLSASGVPVWSDTRNLNQDIFGAPCRTGQCRK